MGTVLRFVQNYRVVVTKKYSALKKQIILNLKILVPFSFL